MYDLIIIGASGHGKVVADIASLNGYKKIAFLDDDRSISECGGYPVIGCCEAAPKGAIFVAIGNAGLRKKMLDLYKDREIPVLIHPDAVVAESAVIGKGTVVMAGAVINPYASIGCGSIVNTCSSVDHDCNVGDYSHVAVGAHLCGTVSVGDRVWIGAGSVVINNLDICDDVMIGAGATVVDSIDEEGLYLGTPARKVNRG